MFDCTRLLSSPVLTGEVDSAQPKTEGIFFLSLPAPRGEVARVFA